MTALTLKLTAQELKLLTALASDQLFRREFIDPNIPGYRKDLDQLSMAKDLVARMKIMMEPAYRTQSAAAKRKRSSRAL
jgi:hypothetical protein